VVVVVVAKKLVLEAMVALVVVRRKSLQPLGLVQQTKAIAAV
jgi:hypothetical protein